MNKEDPIYKFTEETRKEFERIKALDLPKERKDEIAQLYWNARRWCHPNAFSR